MIIIDFFLQFEDIVEGMPIVDLLIYTPFNFIDCFGQVYGIMMVQ